MNPPIRPAVISEADPGAAIALAARSAGVPWLAVPQSDAAALSPVRTTLLTTHTVWTVWVAGEAGRVMGVAAGHGCGLGHLYGHPGARDPPVATQRLEAVRAVTPVKLVRSAFRRHVRASCFQEAPDSRHAWHRPVAVAGGH